MKKLNGTEFVIELQSRLFIGTSKENEIEFYDRMSRQYIWYEGSQLKVRFVAEKSGMKLKNIFRAFGISDVHSLLRKANLRHKVVVGYTSSDEGLIKQFSI